MKYRVTARSWSAPMVEVFGKCDSTHELSDSGVVSAILRFGRADIYEEGEARVLDFLNDYDNGIKNVKLITT